MGIVRSKEMVGTKSSKLIVRIYVADVSNKNLL